MTFGEKVLWKELRKLDMNFRRQAPIGRYVTDFAQHTLRLVIEVDGPIHEEAERQIADAERTAWLESQGYRVIRFSSKDVVEDTARVVDSIRAEGLSPPSQPFPHRGGRA